MKITVKELFKEASDVIEELIEKMANIQEENEQMRIELLELKEASEREKVAAILEERSLTSMSKIASLRNGSLSKEEFERLKIIAESNILDSNFEYDKETKIATDYNIPETPMESLERRRQERAEMLYNDLQNFIYNYK